MRISSEDRFVSIFELETLEIRRFLTTASVSATHVLTITGTGGNDDITVNKLSNGQVAVSGVVAHFKPGSGAGQFNTIKIDAGAGNDNVTINNNVPYTSSSIAGGKGNDKLTGGKGNDDIGGGDDDDVLDGGGGGADALHGDAGADDVANYSNRSDNLYINLDGKANDGTLKKGQTVSKEGDNVDCEEVDAGSGDDILIGSDNADVLNGGGGADEIHGRGGNDVLIGEPGIDQLAGDGGDDSIIARNDGSNDVYSGGNGFDLAKTDATDVNDPSLSDSGSNASPLASPPLPTDPDPSYGNGGTQAGPIYNWTDINSATVDANGRVIFVGSKSLGYNQSDMVVARYTADGQPDNSFGYGGEVVVDFTTSNGYGFHDNSNGFGVTVGQNDVIFAVGSVMKHSQLRNDTDMAVAELDDNGHPVSGFGNNVNPGQDVIDLGDSVTGQSNDAAYDAVVQSDGNLVLAGDRQFSGSHQTYDPGNDFDPANNPTIDPAVWTYGYSNSLNDFFNTYDRSFTDNTNLPGWNSSTLTSAVSPAPDVVYNSGDSDGSVEGIRQGDVGLMPGFYGQYSEIQFTVPQTGQYEINGAFYQTNNSSDADVHILQDGSSIDDATLGSDTSEHDFDQFVQLNAGETITFAVGYGADQNYTQDLTGLDATVQLLSTSADDAIAVARVSSTTGELDQSFNNGAGFNAIDLGGGEHGSAVALQSLPEDSGAQRIVVGGNVDGTMAVARLLSDGTLDTSFGDNGATINAEDSFGSLNDLVVDSNNNIFTVGQVQNSFDSGAAPQGGPQNNSFADLAKYDSGGFFSTNVQESNGDAPSYNCVAIDANGNVLAVGTDGNDYLVGRYDASLNFDQNFSSGPITTDLGAQDTALAVGTLSTGEIVAGGATDFGGGDLEGSAVRYLGDNIPPSDQDVENPITDDSTPPELQDVIDNTSPSTQLIVSSQPLSDGSATIDTSGTNFNDLITISRVYDSHGKRLYAATVNGVVDYYDPNVLTKLTVITGDGNDTVNADSSVKVELIIEGGEGNDSLNGDGDECVIMGEGGNDIINGGADSEVLVGGSGSDKLYANGKNDIVIGGEGTDSAYGGTGEDILIGGTTSYDEDPDALLSILAEWRSGNSNATRVNNIRNGGGLNGSNVFVGSKGAQTVFDDGSKDMLDGGSGRDWFFRPISGVTDQIKNGNGEVYDQV